MARRKSKSALNQMKVVVNQEDIEKVEELHDIDLVEEVKEMAAEEYGVSEVEVVVESKKEPQEISLKVSGEKLSEVLEKKAVPEEPKEEVVEEKVDETPRPAGLRSLDYDVKKRLTHRELRLYQRTGILPK